MNNQNIILQLLLYTPRVYSGLDHYIVELTRQAIANDKQMVCVYADTMEYAPTLQQDLEQAGAIIELVDSKHLFRDIWRLYRKYSPLVVDTHFYKEVRLYTLCFSLIYGVKHFTHIHSLLGDVNLYCVSIKGKIKHYLWGIYYWLLTMGSKRVICISEAITTQFREWSYGKCSNIQTLYIGTPLQEPTMDKIVIRCNLALPVDAFILTNISAIEQIKGIDLILSAMALLKQEGVETLFVHIGGLRGQTEAELKYEKLLHNMVAELGLQDNVIWLGRRTNIQQLLPFADVYLHPSRSEGLGSALLEASYAGLPCIGSRIGGIPEVIEDRKTGLLVDNENILQLKDAILLLYTNQNLRYQYGYNARIRVISYFNQLNQCKEQMELYNIK